MTPRMALPMRKGTRPKIVPTPSPISTCGRFTSCICIRCSNTPGACTSRFNNCAPAQKQSSTNTAYAILPGVEASRFFPFRSEKGFDKVKSAISTSATHDERRLKAGDTYVILTGHSDCQYQIGDNLHRNAAENNQILPTLTFLLHIFFLINI
nr:MAG TPA: hypothetical protein [Caudoviricetes sp.]